MKKYNVYIRVLRLFIFTALLTVVSCTKNDEGYLQDNKVDPALLPVASFTASATDIYKKQTVTFTSTTTNSPNLYTWRFEGGTPSYSNEPNPTIKYTVVGTFKVTLKVRNSFGANEVTYTNFIKVTGVPLDPSITVKLNFEGKGLLNEGSVGGNASNLGSPTYTIGIVDADAYTLSGTNPLTMTGYKGINGKDARSVSLWVKTSQAAVAGIVHWGASATYGRASFKLNADGTTRFEWQGGGLNGIAKINDNKWHHIAYTFNGTDTLVLYVDGVQDAITTSAGVIDTGVGGLSDVNIGSQAGASFFLGTIDDVRIYNKAITPSEVDVLFKNNF